MQRVASFSGRHRQRGAAASRSKRSEAVAAIGTSATAGIETLARMSGQCLPKLVGVPASYNHELKAELLYDLCAALVRCGLGMPAHWTKASANGNLFVQRAIRNAITEERLDLLKRNLEYHLQFTEVIDRFGDEHALEASELAVIITTGNCGYLEIGPALEALEDQEKGLGTAFYWQLTYALYRVMRVYNHDDALMYEERQREYAQEDEENSSQYEFPEVEKGLPDCIRASMKREHGKCQIADRLLLRKHHKGEFAAWIEKLRNIQRLARCYRNAAHDLNDSGYYDSAPVPSLLIAFKQHDVITACFDEESQYMLEGTPEPALSIVFCPHDAVEVARTRRAVEQFIAINCDLFRLVEEIQEWGAKHGNRDGDRGELSLRAA